ncbi:MAG: threonine ammonia-lyase [Candidatus Sumerlaeaceae bacterium]|nr:threonine ammonia-lyase [Candidatus Sumerlaeaceae bacterium]
MAGSEDSETLTRQLQLADVQAARDRMAGKLKPTPINHSAFFSRAWGCDVFFKLESLHPTGSFKERGALNKMLAMPVAERGNGVITASAGNHGQALAYHAGHLAIPCTVVMPINTPLIKMQNTKSHGATVVMEGATFDDAADHARRLCAEQNLTYVHGFDDPDIIAGQGTMGLELLEQLPDMDAVVIPVGGGGLLAGTALTLKESRPSIRIIGVQSSHCQSMIAAMDGGAPQTVPPDRTIADGIAVRRVGAQCLELARRYTDQMVAVDEDEIANAILLLLERDKKVVEGAGAVGFAAVHNRHVSLEGKKVVIVLSGGNIDVNLLARIIVRGLAKDGRLVSLRVVVPDNPGQLARILQVVADLRANIMEVSHNRAFGNAAAGETTIDLTLETRGPDHIEEIQRALLAHGVHTTRQT